MLVADEHGLRLDTGTRERPAAAHRVGPPPLPQRRPAEGGQLMAIFTWCFGIGAWLVIIFLFLPLIDQAKVVQRRAAVREGDRRAQRKDEELTRKAREKTPFPPENKDEAKNEEFKRSQRDRERKQWENEKAELQELVDRAEYRAQVSYYWYEWGMLAGYLILAVGAIGFLHPSQTTTRRVVGGVVIAAQVLLVFVAFVITAVASPFRFMM
jgi:hypothetical protein